MGKLTCAEAYSVSPARWCQNMAVSSPSSRTVTVRSSAIASANSQHACRSASIEPWPSQAKTSPRAEKTVL